MHKAVTKTRTGLGLDWNSPKPFCVFRDFVLLFYYCNILESMFPDRLVKEVICTGYCYVLGF